MKWLQMAGLALFILFGMSQSGWASEAHGHVDHGELVAMFLFVVAMLVVGRAGAIVQRWGFPPVLGELLAGVVLFNTLVAAGWSSIEVLRDHELVEFAALIGVILLLFKAGLEENLREMLEVGLLSVGVALVGVILPGIGGYLVSSFLFPDAGLTSHIFVGATLVATSVGITAKLFEDLRYEGRTKRLVIGAAVIDDVIGLVVLAVVAAMADGEAITATLVGITVGKAAGFLLASIVAGIVLAPVIGRLLSLVHTGVGMKQAMALLFCAGFAWAAKVTVDLEPIVGAFAAGLVLTATHFRNFDHSFQVDRLSRWMEQLTPEQESMREEMRIQKEKKEHEHVESLVEGFARVFIPIFFVHTGMKVNVGVFTDPKTLLLASGIAVVAILGKLACGLVAGSANKGIVGWAMVARGEVGLVFAGLGFSKGVFSADVFAVMIVVVIATTFVPPLVLPGLVRKDQRQEVESTTAQLAAETH